MLREATATERSESKPTPYRLICSPPRWLEAQPEAHSKMPNAQVAPKKRTGLVAHTQLREKSCEPTMSSVATQRPPLRQTKAGSAMQGSTPSATCTCFTPLTTVT